MYFNEGDVVCLKHDPGKPMQVVEVTRSVGIWAYGPDIWVKCAWQDESGKPCVKGFNPEHLRNLDWERP